MSFSKELEKDEKHSFLDILITKSESRFITSIYRKPTLGREPIETGAFFVPKIVYFFYFMDFILEEKCTWLGIEI